MSATPQPRTRSRFVSLLAWAAVIACAVFAALNLRVNTSITHFLVSPDAERLGAILQELADSELSRGMVFTVEAPTLSQRLDGAAALAHALEDDPEVAWVRAGTPAGIERAVYDLYFPRRFRFASDEPERQLPERLSQDGLKDAAAQLRAAVASPMGPAIKPLAPQDPWLLFHERMRALEAARLGDVELEGDQFVADGGRYAVVFLATKHSPFSSAHQAPFEARLQAEMDRIAARREGLRFERSSVHRLALRSERSIRADIRRISAFSLAAIVVLFLGVYRSLRWLLLAMVPLAAGVTVAIAVGLAIFGELHGLTLAFGSTLIGVCIDYPVHYFTHRLLGSSADSKESTMARVWPGLVLGASTTVVGFLGLAWASFPGLREIGVFSAVGVTAALFATRLLLPPWLGPSPAAPKWLKQWAMAARPVSRERSWRGVAGLMTIPAMAVAICAVGLPRVQWVDDTQALNRLEPVALEEDQRVRERVSRLSLGRFVLAMGADEEQALQRNDSVERALADGRAAEVRSLHSFLWSADLQDRSLAQFESRPALAERMLDALEAAGFRRASFEGLDQALGGPHPPALRLDDLLQSPLAGAVRPFVVTLGDKVGVLTYLEAIHDPALLAQRLEPLEGVIDFDRQELMTATYRDYRERTQLLVGIGLLLVGVVLWLRYRRIRMVVVAFVPAALAALTTVSLLALAGVSLNLLHLVGLLLVSSIGVDYGVFLAESMRHPHGMRVTMIGLVVACLSTVAGFGLLALSTNPALHAVGVTTGVGVLLALLLAPTSSILVGRSRDHAQASATTPLENQGE